MYDNMIDWLNPPKAITSEGQEKTIFGSVHLIQNKTDIKNMADFSHSLGSKTSGLFNFSMMLKRLIMQGLTIGLH